MERWKITEMSECRTKSENESSLFKTLSFKGSQLSQMSRALLCYKKILIQLLTSIALSLNSFFSQGSQEWIARRQHNAQFTEEFQTSLRHSLKPFYFPSFLCWKSSERMREDSHRSDSTELFGTRVPPQGPTPRWFILWASTRSRGSRPWYLAPVSGENRLLVHNLLPLQDAKMSHVENWRVGLLRVSSSVQYTPWFNDGLFCCSFMDFL